jgi:hypothetical protein
MPNRIALRRLVEFFRSSGAIASTPTSVTAKVGVGIFGNTDSFLEGMREVISLYLTKRPIRHTISMNLESGHS